MKNVIGTSKAVAMVAVSPGIAPTNIPKAADATMTQQDEGVEDQHRCGDEGVHCGPTESVLSQPRGSGTRSSVEKNQMDRQGRDGRDDERRSAGRAPSQMNRVSRNAKASRNEADRVRQRECRASSSSSTRKKLVSRDGSRTQGAISIHFAPSAARRSRSRSARKPQTINRRSQNQGNTPGRSVVR